VGAAQQLVAMATSQVTPASYDFREASRLGSDELWGGLPNNTATRGICGLLKGESTADLPVRHPAIFDFAINIVTATALGLTAAPMLLARADEVIE
jgi:putative ABC transport system substrate-binding protein